MWHQLVSSLAIISGCILAAEPARAAMPVADNGDNDAELFHETDSNALIAGEGPTFARTDATTGGAGDDAMFATAKVVDGEELDEARGGFVLDGLDIRLGAEVQTLVNGELAMTCRMPAVAVCRSNASRCSVSSRAFSIAITACAAKFSNSAISFSENGWTLSRYKLMQPSAVPSFRNGTQRPVRRFMRSRWSRLDAISGETGTVLKSGVCLEGPPCINA